MIRQLVTDSIAKLKSQAESNEKILADRHNTLNWFLAITSILFTFFYRFSTDEPHNCLEKVGLQISEINFILIVTTFIVYKIVHQQFLKTQIYLYDNLNTHHLELKYNVNKLKELHDFDKLNSNKAVFDVIQFYNHFTSAKFRFYQNLDNRDVEFGHLYRQISNLSNWLNRIFTGLFILFATYLCTAIFLMLT